MSLDFKSIKNVLNATGVGRVESSSVNVGRSVWSVFGDTLGTVERKKVWGIGWVVL